MADTMNDKKRIYLASPTIHGDEQRYVADAFEDNWVAPLGPNVNHFETEIAAYTGCGHAAALSSGTAAIHLGLKLLGVGQGDVVFVSSLTFSASCNPICYEKATPVFIDSEPDTWNMSPEALEKAFAQYPNPKAVVVVHLYGTPAKMDAIMQICEKHHVPYWKMRRNRWVRYTKAGRQARSGVSGCTPLTETRLSRPQAAV